MRKELLYINADILGGGESVWWIPELGVVGHIVSGGPFEVIAVVKPSLRYTVTSLLEALVMNDAEWDEIRDHIHSMCTPVKHTHS